MKKLLLLIAFSVLCILTVNAQKLVKSYKVTFDDQLRPILTVNLHNKLPKQVTHIVYYFSFFDSSGWANTSVSRSLMDQQSTTTTRQLSLKPNYTMSDSFVIPQLNRGENAEPKAIKIVMVRYADGTVDRNITR